MSGTDTSGWSVQGRPYASDGSAQGAEFLVNTYTTNDQGYPAVATAGDRDFIVVWVTDAGDYSLKGQRYRVPAAPPVPAMSQVTRFALGAALALLGAAYALRRRA